jgi:hypothetical protein
MGANDNAAGDPFNRFWTDWMAQMGAMGVVPPSGPSCEEAMKQMRKGFFDAWAKHCDEFMRSEPFLDAMKRSMDNALAFKQQLNEFLTRSLHDGQAPARSDTDSIMLVLRSFEDRLLKRIDTLDARLTALEAHLGRVTAKSATAGNSSTAPRAAKGNKGAGR